MIYIFISKSKSALKATIFKETKKSSRSNFLASIKYIMVASSMFVLFVCFITIFLMIQKDFSYIMQA